MSEVYDVIVIGGGSAGLTAAAVVGEIGKKVALIEREKIGGDCTWTGCIPSKTLLKVAKVAHSVRTAGTYGISVDEPVIDMKQVKERIFQSIHTVYQHETPEAVAKRGIEFISGDAKFIDSHTIQVAEQKLKAKKIVIATGGRATVPPIPGLDTVPYKTNATIFDNEQLPEHLLILGAGPIGMELGQAYSRLGAKVTIVSDEVMAQDEPEAVEVLKKVFSDEGVTIIESLVTAVEEADGNILLKLKNAQDVRGDMLLLAVGRTPNVESLGLDKAGIVYSKQGIAVNKYLQTNIPHIYAIGDVTTGPKFTHYAGFQGAVAGRNVLLPFAKSNGHEDVLPWVTFTDPEVAHVGLTEAQARKQYGDAVKIFTFPMAIGDRAVAEGDTEGFIKLVYRGRRDLLGATVVAERAGEMIIEYELIIKKKISLSALVGIMHPYPTYSDMVQKSLSKLLVKEMLASKIGQFAKESGHLSPMIDDIMRRTKDVVLEPVVNIVGDNVSPMTITLCAGGLGVMSALAAWQGAYTLGLLFWLGNRFLDGLDGAVARAHAKQSDFGGYIDTLVDFTMYSIIPLGLAMHAPQMSQLIVLAFLFGTFYINAGAFLYLSAILERRNQGVEQSGELTTVTMPRGIIEGTEAIIIFCLFFLFPQHLTLLFGILGTLVLATTIQHIIWSMRNL